MPSLLEPKNLICFIIFSSHSYILVYKNSGLIPCYDFREFGRYHQVLHYTEGRPFPYVIRGKIAEFPVFSLHIREFVPTLRVLFLLS